MMSRKDVPQKIGDLLAEVLSEKGYYNICKEYSIMNRWPEIVDKNFAKASACEKIENGIVYVKVAHSSWRQEAVYLKENILHRIHDEYHCPTIKDIVFY